MPGLLQTAEVPLFPAEALEPPPLGLLNLVRPPGPLQTAEAQKLPVLRPRPPPEPLLAALSLPAASPPVQAPLLAELPLALLRK